MTGTTDNDDQPAGRARFNSVQFQLPLHPRMNNVIEEHSPNSSARPSLEDTSPIEEEESPSAYNRRGTWGEIDTGIVNEEDAFEAFEQLREEHLELRRRRASETRRTSFASFTRRRPSAPRRKSSTTPQWATPQWRKKSRQDSQVPSIHESTRQPSYQHEVESLPEIDSSSSNEDDEEDAAGRDDESEFELDVFMREGHFEKRNARGSKKRVSVIYEHLTVHGVENGSKFVKTIPQAILGTFGPDLYRFLSKVLPFLQSKKPSSRKLINDFTGCVRDGEMMLVLGRPGSGCSTFLKAISNERESFAGVTGEVSYGGISAKDQRKYYRGEVTYNPEDDNHFANLSVWQTLTFALMNKTKKHDLLDIPVTVKALMRMFGISHTANTLVGDDMIRGVSGGERKRVSIAETLASKSSVVAWDNSTRGLDASTALDYARSLRIMTDISNRTTFVTLYQAGEGIYQVMDKVMVIEQGRQIFCGPASRAKQYFIDLGFECPERQSTADFLTAITDPSERRFRAGFEHTAPRTTKQFEEAFRTSEDYKVLLEDVANYKAYIERTGHADAKDFVGAVHESKSKTVRKTSPYTVSFYRQVLACTKREAWLLMGDATSLWTSFFIVISMGLCIGSIFYDQPTNTEGALSRGGTLFMSVIFLGWLQMAELMKAVSGRTVVSRHGHYAFYRPSAVAAARVVLDFPVIFVQSTIFCIIMYFLADLDMDAGKFFIYFLFVYMSTFLLTAMYRMFASFSPGMDTAARFSGTALNLLIIYTGYIIPKRQVLSRSIWFGWLYYINPLTYAFEAVLTNELSSREMECAPSQLVPQGPDVDPKFQGCAVAGARPGSTVVAGADFLDAAYDYNVSHIWRNFGIILGFAIFYIAVTIVVIETVNPAEDAGSGGLIFKKSRKTKQQAKEARRPLDEEKAIKQERNKEEYDSGTASSNSSQSGISRSNTGNSHKDENIHQALKELSKKESIFTWKEVEYSVPYMGGQRKLLNKVSGYAKPGVMIALMGSSGAGKTTLLYTLSQRQTVGVISGEMLVDGRPLNKEFQRNTGFCLQGDIHDKTQTVREALEFSALLRREASVPREEKIAYVDKVIDLLELEELEDAVITSLGVEQRKRLTIGVELAAKPSLLLFLDEPTSGLDSQGAYSIIRFLKKLCQSGQAIICTIHQPSSVLIQQFDMVLALNPGGNTFYFGPMGNNGEHLIKYFADRGAICPHRKNIAEFILETAARPHHRRDGTKIDWNKEWRESSEAEEVLNEIRRLERSRSIATIDYHNEKKARNVPELAFATSSWFQTAQLTKRLFRQQWRDPSYIYGKLFTATTIAIFIGFTFWQLGTSVQDMQNRMFTCFFLSTVPGTIVNVVLPKFYDNMNIWQAREYPSRIYGWVAFCTANIISELPVAIVSGTLYWILWYWPSGLPSESGASGYAFMMTVLMHLFMNSWGQWIGAFAPSFTVISNVSRDSPRHLKVFFTNKNKDFAVFLCCVWSIQRRGETL